MAPERDFFLPSLTDLLQVLGSAGLVVGACIGFFVPAAGTRQLLENVALGGAVGAIVGAIVAFALGAGISVGGSL